MSPSVASFKSVLGNGFVKSAKNGGLKVFTDVVIFEKQNDSPTTVVPTRISGAGVTDSEEFESHFYSIDLNCECGANLIVITATAIQKKYFPVQYPYVLHCTSMDDVRETLEDVSTCVLNVCDLQARKAICNRCSVSSSEKKSAQEQNKKRSLTHR